MAKIDIRHKVWVNDESPDIMASNLNDNQQALEKCVEVANKFNGITNVINEDGYNYPKERYLVTSKNLKDITKALTDKGVDSTGLFKNVPEEIRSIEGGGSAVSVYELIKLDECPLEWGGSSAGPTGVDSINGLSVTLNYVNRNVTLNTTTNKMTVTLPDGSTKEVISSVVTDYDYHLPPAGSPFPRDNFTLLTNDNVLRKTDIYNWDADYTSATVVTNYEYLDDIPEGTFLTGTGWRASKEWNSSKKGYEAVIYVEPGYRAKYGNASFYNGEKIFSFDANQQALAPSITVYRDF